MIKKINFPLSFFLFGIYDILLGLSFIVFYRNIYKALNITLPNHPGYIFVPAAFIVCGGIGELLIAKNPFKNIDLVIIRLLMKLSFAAIVMYCYFTVGIPAIFLIIAMLSILGIIKNSIFIYLTKEKISGN